MRLIDLYITQLKAHGPSRTCKESEEEGGVGGYQVSVVLEGRLAARDVENVLDEPPMVEPPSA